MTFKELFDTALPQCTEFKNDMDSARYEFEKHVNAILKPIVEDNPYFDSIFCHVSYGRLNDPQITLSQTSRNNRKYLSFPLITFKLKLERGTKHHSYYEDWYEYKTKAYSNIHVIGMNEEESATAFDTVDIMTLVKNFYDTNLSVQENVKAEQEYISFITKLEIEHSDLISTLQTAVQQFKALDEQSQDYINNKLYNNTERKIARW